MTINIKTYDRTFGELSRNETITGNDLCLTPFINSNCTYLPIFVFKKEGNMNTTYIKNGDEYWLKPDAKSFYTTNVWKSMSEEQDKEITHKFNKLIKAVNDNYIYYRPPRGRNISFMTTLMSSWHLELEKLLLNKMTNLDDIRLFSKRFWNGQWWWYSSASHIKPITFDIKPITFAEFLNNRSLSRYIQKARKEVNKNAKIYINHA